MRRTMYTLHSLLLRTFTPFFFENETVFSLFAGEKETTGFMCNKVEWIGKTIITQNTC